MGDHTQVAESDALTTEEQQLLESFNSTWTEYPREKTVHELFELQAKRTPQRTAVVMEDRSLTYQELDSRSNRLARKLKAWGVQADTIVGTMLEKSVEMVVAYLAILKAGGAFMPIDPAFPQARIRYMLEDSQTPLVLARGNETVAGVPFFDVEELLLDQEGDEENDQALRPSSGPSHLCYIIYTSGSTGQPKGVMVEHRQLVNLLHWHLRYFEITEADNATQYAASVFGVSIGELFPYLITGACVHLVPERLRTNLTALNDYMIEQRITMAWLPPQVCDSFMELENPVLRNLFTGGDAVRFRKKNQYKVFNGYGTTETLNSTIYPIGEEISKVIGIPIHNAQIYILDENQRSVPIGVMGELCIAGDVVARGYLNKPELTAEKFVECPYQPGVRMYRTGDLARWLPDGNLEYFGRRDHQIKIRGMRVELGEIEEQIARADGVLETAVIAIQTPSQEPALIGFFRGKEESTVQDVQTHLQERLPAHLIPSKLIKVDQFPRTASGKVDRKALAEAEAAKPREAGVAYLPPANESEAKMAQLWEATMGIRPIGTETRFLDLGGTSLTAMRLTSAIYKEFGVAIPVTELFAAGTIKQLCERLQNGEYSTARSLIKTSGRDFQRATSVQKRLYFIQQLSASSVAYNTPAAFEFEGNVDADRLEMALCEMVNRHESLRTSFVFRDGELMQQIVRNPTFALERHKIDQTANVVEKVKSLVQPFPLGEAPLFRAALVEQAHGSTYLFLDFHHIVMDGISTGIFLDELSRLYAGEAVGEVKFQYQDFSQWREERETEEEQSRLRDYWSSVLAGCPVVMDVPTDRVRPEVQSFRGDRCAVKLDPVKAGLTREAATMQGVTPYQWLLSAFHILLSRHCGQYDVITGTVMAGRSAAEFDGTIGMFANTVPIRSFPTGDKRLDTYLQEMKAICLGAYEHQDYPLDQILRDLNITGDMSRNPLLNVNFVYQDADLYRLQVPGVPCKPLDLGADVSKFDLTLEVIESGEQFEIACTYATDLFTKETVVSLLEQYEQLLTSMLQEPNPVIADIEMLGGESKQLLLTQLRGPVDLQAVEKSIPQLFEEQVALSPDREALRFRGESLTYRAFNRRANQLARFLRDRGVRQNTVVAISMERSFEMMISLFAVLKAGGAYVMIDPEYPTARIEYMLANSGAVLLLVNRMEGALSLASDTEILDVGKSTDFERFEDGNLDLPYDPEQLLYLQYTSGSTGQPKGVRIRSRSFLNMLLWFVREFQFDAKTRNLLIAPSGFDLAQRNFYGTLITGGLLYLNEPGYYRYDHMSDLIEAEQITMINCAPSAFYPFMDYNRQTDYAKLRSLRRVFFGGEVTKLAQLLDWKQSPNCRVEFINMYGPAECSCCTTFHRIQEADWSQAAMTTIGKPIPNMQVFVLGPHQELLPPGRVGELCVSGIGLAEGYHNAPEQTAKKFVDGSRVGVSRLYRTGDLVRLAPDGELRFVGRADTQVKISGQRIELEEIESVLLKHPSVRSAAVIDREDPTGHKMLVAYLMAHDAVILDRDELKQHVALHLPKIMQPAVYLRIERLPLSPNGKLDKTKLPAPDFSQQTTSAMASDAPGPRDESERLLTDLWASLFGMAAESIRIDSNFFELGGDSIRAIQLCARLYQMGYRLEIKDVFFCKTIAEISRQITRLEREIEQGPVSGEVRVTPIQQGFFERGLEEQHHYNQSQVLFRPEGFHAPWVREALQKLVEHHDALRMTYSFDGEEVRQINRGLTEPFFDFTLHDHPVGTDVADWIEETTNAIQSSFDLSRGPLVKVALLKTQTGDHLAIVIHHLVVDGVSWRILLEDFQQAYGQLQNGLPVKLPMKTDSYQTWAASLPRYAASEQSLKEQKYWRQLATETYEPLPVRKVISNRPLRECRTERIAFSAADTNLLLTEVHQAYNTESNDILLAALSLAIYRFAGIKRLLLRVEGHGRESFGDDVNVSRTIGWFTSEFPVLLAVQEPLAIPDLIRTTKETLRKIPKKGAGFGIFKYHGDATMTASLRALMPEISFNYLGQFDQDRSQETFQQSPYRAGLDRSPNNRMAYKLNLNGLVQNGELRFEVDAHTEEFSQEDLALFLDHFQQSLLELIRHCTSKQDREFTPSDMSGKDLELEEIEEIFQLFDEDFEWE